MEKENKNKVLIIPTSNVLKNHENLVDSVRQAVHDVSTKIQEFEPEIIIAGNAVADEYSEHEKDAYNHERKQINVDKYSSVLFKNTNILGPERIPTIILTDKDMNYENRETDFVFGIGYDSPQLSVQSFNRIIKATDDKISQSSIANYLARHEYGHMLGLNRSNYAEPDKRGGIYEGHCGANACTMNQVTSISEIIALLEKLDDNSDKLVAGFCVHCVAKLRENRKKINNPIRKKVFKEIKPKNPNRVFEEIKSNGDRVKINPSEASEKDNTNNDKPPKRPGRVFEEVK